MIWKARSCKSTELCHHFLAGGLAHPFMRKVNGRQAVRPSVALRLPHPLRFFKGWETTDLKSRFISFEFIGRGETI